MEEKVIDYLKRDIRKVIDKISGRFGFYEKSINKEEVEIFIPFPKSEIIIRKYEDVDFLILEDKEQFIKLNSDANTTETIHTIS